MSQVEGQTTEAEGQAPKDETVNDRLLKESKEYKSKYQEAVKKLETIEKERLQKEGTHEEKLQKAFEENQKLMETLGTVKTKAIKANVIATLSKYASDAHSIEDLLSLKQASMIEYDEENLEPTSESVQKFITELREKKPYLFGGKKVTPQADGKPATDKGTKSYSQMTAHEKAQAMKESFKVLL